MGFPVGASVKNLPASAEDLRDNDSTPGSGRSPGEGNGNPLQYSCLENPMDRGAWRATVHGVTRVGHDLVTKPSIILGGFPGGSDSKESACNAGDLGLILGSGRFPGEGNGYPRQYSCLENSMDREAWQATVHGIAKSWT